MSRSRGTKISTGEDRIWIGNKNAVIRFPGVHFGFLNSEHSISESNSLGCTTSGFRDSEPDKHWDFPPAQSDGLLYDLLLVQLVFFKLSHIRFDHFYMYQ